MMPSLPQLLLILLVVLVIFGAGKLPRVMGDIGKGMKSFREGVKDDKTPQDSDVKEAAAIEKADDAPSERS